MRAQEKINIYTNKYTDFCKASGLPTRMERIQTAGYRKVKVVDNSAESGIINYGASIAKRNTGKRLKFNSNASFKVNVLEYSDKVNKGVSIACKEVAIKGGKDEKEHLCLVNLNDGEIVYRESGVYDMVGGKDFWEYVNKHKENNFCFVHNHNTDGYFSETDMATLLKTENIKGFTAVRIDGVIYHAVKNENVHIEGNFDKIFSNELAEVNKMLRDGIISAGERTRRREEIIVDGAIKKYTKGMYEFE